MVKAAKGYRGVRSTHFTFAKNAVMKAGLNSYRNRKRKQRTFRNLWIARINAACRPMGISYSRLVDAMTKKGVVVNRKMLSELAIHNPEVFKAVVESVR